MTKFALALYSHQTQKLTLTFAKATDKRHAFTIAFPQEEKAHVADCETYEELVTELYDQDCDLKIEEVV